MSVINLKEDEMIQDDILFSKVDGDGWISHMFTPKGTLSVRIGGRGTMSNDKSLYEVWYPTEDQPKGDQTANNIWDFLKACYENNKR